MVLDAVIFSQKFLGEYEILMILLFKVSLTTVTLIAIAATIRTDTGVS